jgi:hypothetical protein
MTMFESRAAVRRELALHPDADRTALAIPFSEIIGAGPVPAREAIEALTAYLLDPSGGALLSTSADRATWLESPLFSWVGPGNAAPLDDQIAALVVGPILGRGTSLAPVLVASRFAPRADDVLALAVASLELPAQAAVLETLFADPGPDPELLALSVIQCGRVLAWAPHLLEWPIAESIVDALIARLEPSRPRPLLDAIARALGPIAAHPGPLGATVRTAALAGLAALTKASSTGASSSFLEQVTAIGKTRTIPDQDKWMALPRKEVAAACAYVLGFASPVDRGEFTAYRAQVLDRPEADELFLPFVEGLVAAAHVPAISELVESMLGGSEAEVATALGLAATIPLDALAAELVARLDAPGASQRAMAIGAIELLVSTEDLDIDASLALRLGDPSPEVTAAATRTLLARGRRDLVAKHSAKDPHPVRRAVVLAALGELSIPVISELVRGTIDGLDAIDTTTEDPTSDDDVTPITKLIADSLLCSVAGLEVACDLIGGVPDAAGLLALACLPGAQRDIGILAPPQARTLLAQVTIELVTDNPDSDLGSLALYLLARMSAGDETIAEVIADALTATEGYAGNLLGALGEIRVASEPTARALAPLLGPDSPLGARVAASAVSGRVLPHDHEAWVHVRELLELGTLARSAAWSALRDRSRRRPVAIPA